MIRRVRFTPSSLLRRCFGATTRRRELRSIAELPDRIYPAFKETSSHDLLALHWPEPPRNLLIVRKEDNRDVDNAVFTYINHVKAEYPKTSVIVEPNVAKLIHNSFEFPIYTRDNDTPYHEKVDLTTTLGGDGTVLHAASLFATATSVPPVLSFSMGTLGFLGEWNFKEHKHALRSVVASGAPAPQSVDDPPKQNAHTSSLAKWADVRGQSMGKSRTSRVLMRNRLRIGLFSANGERLPHEPPFAHHGDANEDIFALNEVLLHRGAFPHLSHITILIGTPPNQQELTTAIADGFLVSTPTGSTAYSLSSGGSIVHPLVSSLLLTPICPRSLSFRPLVLPANTPVTLRIEPTTRSTEVEVSVDGVRRQHGLSPGMEVRVVGEEVRTPGAPGARDWRGGVPSIVRSGGERGEDHWVGGLNSLLKFNYPFGKDG
ncbi:ATP-NAD kinase [Acrodontium crateriforme]|uniref:ATP-NAD kinase n=1 Tax=Acrodontium crateriforme TaxID=150365 RepID=A0AAQ3M421_9PEZI|nr:ATP-NAD kinase [Acrodontium crateriforme]